MGKKSRKKKNRTSKGRSGRGSGSPARRGPPHLQGEGARSDALHTVPLDPRPAWYLRLDSALAVNDQAAAQSILDELAPPHGALPVRRRLSMLWRIWPERFVEEAEGLVRSGAWPEAVEAVVAEAALALPEALVGRLLDVDAPWARDLGTLHQASLLISRGEDEEAASVLRSIGLRSPFRHGRLFLRGLSAYYQKRDEEAARALGQVRDHPTYGKLSRVLCQRLQPSGLDEPPDVAPLLSRDLDALFARTLQDPVILEQGALTRSREHILARRQNQAMGELARWGVPPGSVAAEMLRRELVAMLLSRGVPLSEAVGRVIRAIGASPRDPHGKALMALAQSHIHESEEIADGLTALMQMVSKGRLGLEPETARLGLAALSYQLGKLELERAHPARHPRNTRGGIFVFLGRRPRKPRDPGDCPAVRAFERAVELAPEASEHWRDLHRAARRFGDAPHGDRVLERWVKRHPRDPVAMRAAAEAALRRGAFDKGRRYSQQAAALEPLASEHRDLEARLVRGKAAAKARAGNILAAAVCYEELHGLFREHPIHLRVEAMAEHASLLDALPQGEAAPHGRGRGHGRTFVPAGTTGEALREAATSLDGSGPLLWRWAYEMVSSGLSSRRQGRSSGRQGRGGAGRGLGMTGGPGTLSSQPFRAEPAPAPRSLGELRSLLLSMGSAAARHVVVDPDGRSQVEASVGQHCEILATEEDFRLALGTLRDPGAIEAVARVAHSRFPRTHRFFLAGCLARLVIGKELLHSAQEVTARLGDLLPAPEVCGEAAPDAPPGAAPGQEPGPAPGASRCDTPAPDEERRPPRDPQASLRHDGVDDDDDEYEYDDDDEYDEYDDDEYEYDDDDDEYDDEYDDDDEYDEYDDDDDLALSVLRELMLHQGAIDGSEGLQDWPLSMEKLSAEAPDLCAVGQRLYIVLRVIANLPHQPVFSQIADRMALSLCTGASPVHQGPVAYYAGLLMDAVRLEELKQSIVPGSLDRVLALFVRSRASQLSTPGRRPSPAKPRPRFRFK